MLLADLVETSQRVGATRSRKQKTALLAACLRQLAPDEIAPGVAYLSGELPQRRIGVGYATLRTLAPPRAADQPQLSVAEVHRQIDATAALQGAGSQRGRVEMLTVLLDRATRDEQEFLRRLLVGELRQGALEGVMVAATAEAANVETGAVRRALMLAGNLQSVALTAFERGAEGLASISLELFRPLQPMLAQSATDVDDALDKLGEAALEWKLDGARVQVHRDGDQVAVFTRELNDVTAAVPEVVEAVRSLPVRRIVLDGEVIALRDDGRPQPFQVTMRRFGRKLDVARMRGELPLRAFFFDCLHLDGDDLVDRSAAARFAALAEVADGSVRIPRLVTGSAAAAREFLATALRAGHEGVMAKTLDDTYEAGRRGAGWLKVKPVHTLDLVVLAAEWGSGRRRGWLSNLHLGARDARTGGFVMLGKTFKGLTDELLRWQTTKLQEIQTATDAHTVFVRPELVVEIAFDGVQSSPHYPGGVALRFARVRRYRPDKAAVDADTLDAVLALHVG